MIYNAPTQDLDLRVGLVPLAADLCWNNSPPTKRKPLFRAPPDDSLRKFYEAILASNGNFI